MLEAQDISSEKGEQGANRSNLQFLVRLALGVGILIFLIVRSDISQIRDAITQVNVTWLGLAFLVQILAKVVWAGRWSSLLAMFNMEVPLRRLIRGLFVGLFFGNFLPTSFGGDIYRGLYILDNKTLYRKSLFIIFLERFIGLTTIGYIAVPAIPLLLYNNNQLERSHNILLFLLAGLCTSVLLIHPAFFSTADYIIGKIRKGFFEGSRQKIKNALRIFHEAESGKWRVYVASLLVHSLGVLFYYCLGNSLNLPLEPWHYLIIVPLSVVATLLPITINGLGVREGSLVALVAAIAPDIPASQAVSLGLLSSAIILAVSLIGGGIYIAGKR